ncbi:MAG: cytochrome c, partial [Chloroflexota bacterium]
DGAVAANFVTVSQDNWLAEGHVISETQGAVLYGTYCATCHGPDGEGNGPGTKDNASQGPAAFHQDMSEAYIMWRIWEGVPDSMMPPFQWLLSQQDMWDITAHLRQMTMSSSGGG